MSWNKSRGGMISRAIIAAAGSVAMIGSFAACGGSSASGGSSNGEVSGDINILVSSASASDAAFKAVNKAFTAKYPKAKVNFSSVPNDSYPATKSARLSAGSVDIFVLKNFAETPSYAKSSTPDDVQLAQSGGLVDLTGESFMKHYTRSVLDAAAIGGKDYAVPTGLSYSTGLYYNKKIFEQHGLKAPTTWSELQQVMSTLKAKGVTPFGIGGKDTWPAGLVMLSNVASSYPTLKDKQDLAEGLWKQKVSLKDEKTKAILDRTQKVFENAQEHFSGAGYDDLPAAFARGDFAMMPDGTWNEPTIKTAVNGAFDYGYIPFPGSDNAADNSLLNGKVELQLGVSAGTKNKAGALAWLKFFSDPTNYATFVNGAGYSSAQPDIKTSAFLDSVAQYTKTYQPAWDQVWMANNKAGEDAVYPFNYPALSPLGTQSSAQAADSAQKAWSAAF
ncbi:ABC transporter substrate-binding protein [Bifidobacterium mongoliense]|uniref:ABC transporter substrate-binding protein n=1 Tax=Bifidobacterium mongoliense TaxID=518643 RepID=UPI00264A1121|nr:extracellular solute-binding protein [Bifidobacterium mongoliense]MDN6025224.1 extracellular solute-binding protein [Bifidobacterium mongoliense]MDN6051417.1 extracellular solute-binding protein [Bifidobacterium mongoliense]MDN6720345.1 extracellular solute-binding protein [Bifidobacterium mongoliense]